MPVLTAICPRLWLRLLLVGSAACLYTDLANSTSNKIYAAIGYQPVADFLRYDIS
jgi:predicted GNAT family acetyltransferase